MLEPQIIPEFEDSVIDKDEEGTSFMVVDCYSWYCQSCMRQRPIMWIHAIEAGKTMGLFPYGEPNDQISQKCLENLMG